MKIIISFLLIVSCFLMTNFAQEVEADPNLQKASKAKKKQIGSLLKEVYKSTQTYMNSTDDEKIVVATATTIKNIRSVAKELDKGFFKDTMIAGAGAWEKSLFFRYDEIGKSMLSMADRKEIIEVYKLKDTPPEDRATRLFEFAQSFFDIAADVAVASGVPTNN